MDKIKIQHHIERLEQKHQQLEKRLSLNSDDHIVTVLKKEKLALKDEIEKFKRQIQQ
jgi:hypothetical protein